MRPPCGKGSLAFKMLAKFHSRSPHAHGSVSPEIAQGLLALKKRIAAAKIPPPKLDETINVAVWNVREFGKSRRSEAAVHFIAEILGQFDLVELRDDLTDLGR